MNRFTLFLLAAIITLPSAAQADLVAGFEFNSPPDLEGWSGAGNGHAGTLVIANASTGESVLTSGASLAGNGNGTGTTNNDPQLLHATVALPTGTNWTTVVMRARQLNASAAVQDYAQVGTILFFNPPLSNFGAGTFVGGSAATDDGWATVTWDISSRTTDLTGFRLDPVGGPNTANFGFEVDYVRVFNDAVAVPEPSSVAILGIAFSGLLMRRKRIQG